MGYLFIVSLLVCCMVVCWSQMFVHLWQMCRCLFVVALYSAWQMCRLTGRREAAAWLWLQVTVKTLHTTLQWICKNSCKNMLKIGQYWSELVPSCHDCKKNRCYHKSIFVHICSVLMVTIVKKSQSLCTGECTAYPTGQLWILELSPFWSQAGSDRWM